MNNFIKGLIISGVGLSSSFILYFVFDRPNNIKFMSSDFFWLVGMPVLCVGLIFINTRKKEDLSLGLFGKILLGVLALIWIFMVIMLFVDKIKAI
ncbi:MAG: hypothetical protein U9N53_08955 [Bacteroidota bacterium]|nr:hypothetical protein [Bacteroidota bacterium]